MPKVISMIVPAEADRAPKTVEALESILRYWLEDHSLTLEGSPDQGRTMQGLYAYAMRTLQYAHSAGVTQALAYHRATHADAARSPPLYDPAIHGETHWAQYHNHIAHHIRSTKAGGSRWSKRKSTASPPAPPSEADSTPASKRPRFKRDVADRCRLHPESNHTNARCYQQQPGAGGGGSRPPGTSA